MATLGTTITTTPAPSADTAVGSDVLNRRNMRANNNEILAGTKGGGAVNQATQAALTNATNKGIAQAAGTVGSAKGINSAMAGRTAGNNAAASLQNSANAGAALTAQNTLGSQQLLSNNLQNQYSTETGAKLQQQQINNQQSNAELGAGLQGLGLVGTFLGGFAEGGEVPDEWSVTGAPQPLDTPNVSKAKSKTAQALQSLSKTPMYAKGGAVQALLSPGEKYLSPKKVQEVKDGKDALTAGKTVPGKPLVTGAKDSLKNDIIPAKLESGGIVLPRSVTQSKDPHKAAHKFVSAILTRQGLKKK